MGLLLLAALAGGAWWLFNRVRPPESAGGWTRETGPDGAPLWRGDHSIYNLRYGQLTLPMLVGVVLLLVAIYGGFSSRGVRDWAMTAVMFALAALALGRTVGRKFFGGSWTLTASNGRLLYQSDAPKWTAAVSEIASVEAAPTRQWEQTRKYDGLLMSIPDHEWQTFLVMADQSRRVIYTANADRERSGTLAASIRAYVEGQRMAAKRADPAASAVAASPSPQGEGFDL